MATGIQNSDYQALDPNMRAREVATYLRIGLSTVRLWDAIGKLPKGIRISPRVTVWKKSVLDHFLEQSAADGSK